MSQPDTPTPPPAPPKPPEVQDVESAAGLEKSLLRRRKGTSDAFLTKGQSLLSKGQLGSDRQL